MRPRSRMSLLLSASVCLCVGMTLPAFSAVDSPKTASSQTLKVQADAADKKGDKKTSATLMLDLANAYAREENNDAAKAAFAGAIAAADAAFGKDSPATAKALRSAAAFNTKLGLVGDADEQSERAISICRKGGDSQKADLASSLLVRADVLDAQNNSGLAEDCYKEAIEILRTSKPANPTAQMAALRQYAKSLRGLDRTSEAVKLEDQAYEIAAQQKPSTPAVPGKKRDRTSYNDCLSKASEALQRQDFDASLRAYKDAVIEAKKFGDNDPYVPEAMMNLAQGYIMAKQPDMAISTFKDAIELRKKILGPDNAAVGWDLYRLSLAYKMHNKPSEAQEMQEQALAVMRSHNVDPMNYWELMNAKVTSDIQAKRFSSAQEAIEQMTAQAQQRFGSDSYKYALALMLKVQLLFAQQNYKEGQALAATAADLMKKTTSNRADLTKQWADSDKERRRLAKLDE